MALLSFRWIKHPEPNGSRRATPTSHFQQRPGHSLILFGVRELIGGILPAFNSIVYNRNPDLHATRAYTTHLSLNVQNLAAPVDVDLAQALKDVTWQRDNSWRPRHDLSIIDYCVFAGGPEWFGVMTRPLVDRLVRSSIPVAYLGIGSHDRIKNLKFEGISKPDSDLLKKAKLITVRDSRCADLLAPVSPVRLPCPALFAAPQARRRTERRRLALSTQGTSKKNGQCIEQPVFDYSARLFRALAGKYDCTIICHYIDEYYELHSEFGDEFPILFSYDAKDYPEIYEAFDLTVTTRVHGAGLCASLGIPAFLLSHSTRSETATGFLAEIVDVAQTPVEALVARIDAFPVAEKSQELIAHKNAVREKYLELLRQFFQAA